MILLLGCVFIRCAKYIKLYYIDRVVQWGKVLQSNLARLIYIGIPIVLSALGRLSAFTFKNHLKLYEGIPNVRNRALSTSTCCYLYSE